MPDARLIISEVFPPKIGGSGHWLNELFSRIDTHDQHYIAGRTEGDELYDRSANLNIHRANLTYEDWGFFGMQNWRDYLNSCAQIKPILLAHNARRLHCARAVPEGWIAWLLNKRHGARYGCFVHGEELMAYQSSRQLSMMSKQVYKSSAYLIANSLNTKRALLDFVDVQEDRIHVLHPGVDCSVFQPAEHREALRKELGWENRFVLYTIGRVVERKGQRRVIEAMAALTESCPHLHYVIAGDGPDRHHQMRMVDQLNLAGRVHFPGRVSDTEKLQMLQACDLFAMPNIATQTDFEGFGIVFLEAQACGVPVLAGNSGGAPETIIEGETGFAIEPDDAQQLKSLIKQFYDENSKRLKMGQAARSWTEEQFDWPKLVEQANVIFKEVDL